MRRTCKGAGRLEGRDGGNMGQKRMGGVRDSRRACRKLFALGAMVAALLTWSQAIDRASAADRRNGSDSVFITELSDVRRVAVVLNKSRTFKVERPFANRPV